MKTFVKLNLDTRVEAATTSKNCRKLRSAPYHLQVCTLHPQEYLYFTRKRNSTSDILLKTKSQTDLKRPLLTASSNSTSIDMN
jgi:hypothetical protein